jgi:hypothetical protein
MSDGSGAGDDSVYVPGAGTFCASGSDAPVSSILISFEEALTLVARLERPFLRFRPSYSSRSEPDVTTSL